MSLQGAPLPDFKLPYTQPAPGGQNGRVSFYSSGSSAHPSVLTSGSAPTVSASGRSVPDGAGFKYPTHTEQVFSGEMLRGNLERSPLSDAFFSRRNFDRLQEAIQAEVYRASGPKKYRIDRQDVDELKTIARALFLQYSKNSPFDIEGQVTTLNRMVIEWCAPRILSEIDAHLFYLNDISHLPVPLPQPIHLSSAGTKSLPFKNPM
jgi:hypothetical protein